MSRSLVKLVLIGMLFATDQQAFADEQSTEPQKRALLVGCTKYPDKSMELVGPGNDVVLMRELLTSRFGFNDKNIIVLSEAGGKIDLRPTRANIVREFERLIATAKRGDQLVISLAGHGSQQVDDNADDPDDNETDGLDEVFCPADVSSLVTDDSGIIRNAIVDDEIRKWLHAIRSKGASVWIIIDSCHSGTMIRGNNTEVVRRIFPEQLVPPERLKEAAQRAAKKQESTRGKGPVSESLGFAPQAGAGELGDVVAIYAAQSSEPTVERPMPYGSPDAKYYGLLTFTMNQILTQASAPMTYAELAQRIQAQYVSWGRTGPTPLIEGSGCHREVLGVRQWPERSRFTVTRRAEGGWKLNAGQLHGLSHGTVLAVYPPAGQANSDQAAGAVKIVAANAFDSTVEPCEFEKMPLNSKLPEGGRCEVVLKDFGLRKLRLAVVADDVSESTRKVSQQIETKLKALAAQPNSLFDVVASNSDVDWFVRVEKAQADLVPAQGWASNADSKLVQKFGPVPTGEGMAEWLTDNLQRIVRAKHLLSLASSGTEKARGDSDVAVEVELLRFKDENDKEGEVVRWETSGLQLQSGDLVAFRVHNRGRTAVDVTLLFVDSEFGISAVFPDPQTATDNRLLANKSLKTPKFHVTADTLGLEHVTTLAVKASGQPLDFTFLAQPRLERSRGPDLDSPLGQLLKSALFGQGTTRGLGKTAIKDHAFQLLSWQVVPKATSEQSK